MQRFLLAVIWVVACATVAAASPYEDGDAAYNRGEFTLAARLFRSLAEQGHAGTQFNLGVMNSMGEGVPQDYQEALKWYRRAAE